MNVTLAPRVTHHSRQTCYKHVPIRTTALVFIDASKGSPAGPRLFLGCTATLRNPPLQLSVTRLMQDFQTGLIQRGSQGARAGAAAAQMSPHTWRDGTQPDRINDEEGKKMLKNVARFPRLKARRKRVCVLYQCASLPLSG